MPEDRQGLIFGGIVDDDDFDVRVGLLLQTLEADRQVVSPVPVGDDDRDLGKRLLVQR